MKRLEVPEGYWGTDPLESLYRGSFCPRGICLYFEPTKSIARQDYLVEVEEYTSKPYIMAKGGLDGR